MLFVSNLSRDHVFSAHRCVLIFLILVLLHHFGFLQKIVISIFKPKDKGVLVRARAGGTRTTLPKGEKISDCSAIAKSRAQKIAPEPVPLSGTIRGKHRRGWLTHWSSTFSINGQPRTIRYTASQFDKRGRCIYSSRLNRIARDAPTGASLHMTFYYVYVLKSINLDFIYVGFTHDLKRRFKEHNKRENLSTKHYAPFELIHYEAYKNIKDAKRREGYFKTTKGKTTLKLILKEYFS